MQLLFHWRSFDGGKNKTANQNQRTPNSEAWKQLAQNIKSNSFPGPQSNLSNTIQKWVEKNCSNQRLPSNFPKFACFNLQYLLRGQHLAKEINDYYNKHSKNRTRGLQNSPETHTALYAEATNLPEYYVNWLSLKVAFKIILNIHYKREVPTHW